MVSGGNLCEALVSVMNVEVKGGCVWCKGILYLIGAMSQKCEPGPFNSPRKMRVACRSPRCSGFRWCSGGGTSGSRRCCWCGSLYCRYRGGRRLRPGRHRGRKHHQHHRPAHVRTLHDVLVCSIAAEIRPTQISSAKCARRWRAANGAALGLTQNLRGPRESVRCFA